MKKAITLLLSILMIFTLFSTSMTAFANEMPDETGFCGETAQYVIGQISRQLTIMGSGKIEDGFFKNRTDIKSIIIKGQISEIGSSAFEGCTEVESVNILSDEITKIPFAAFKNCHKLETVNLPDSIYNIEAYSFYHCCSIEKIVLPQSTRNIGLRAFDRCLCLKDVSLPENIRNLEDYAFSYCINLSRINVPSDIQKMPSVAFYNCQSLEEFSMPAFDSFPYDYNYFVHCTGLKSFSVQDNDKYYAEVDGVLYNAEKTVLLRYPAGREDKLFVIPETVEEIWNYAFADCYNLENIVIPETVTMIDEGAFSDCYNLKNIKLPSKLTRLDSSAFNSCLSLTDISVPATVNEIGESAFEYCVRLKNITINGNVDLSDSYCIFNRCISLESVSNMSDTYIFEVPTEHSDSMIMGLSEKNPMSIKENAAFLDRECRLSNEYYYSGTLNTIEDELKAYNDIYDKNFKTAEEYALWESEELNNYYTTEFPKDFKIICKENSAQHTTCVENNVNHSVAFTENGRVFDDCDLKCGNHIDVFKNEDIKPNCISVGYKGGTVCLICAEKNDPERLAASVIEEAEPYGEIQPHTPVLLPGDEPTCSRPGYSDFTACAICGAVLVEPELVPPTDHIDEDGDGLCDYCEMPVVEKPESKTFIEIIAEFLANAFSRILSIFKKIFG